MNKENSQFQYRETDGSGFFQFDHFNAFPEITHAFFSRKGGASSGPWQSLNAGHGIGDETEAVNRNLDRILNMSGGNRLISVHQVHGRKAVTYRGETGFSNPFAEADAIITDRPGAALMIRTADCQPILLYDPEKKVVAGIHSGWRGNVQNIIGSTIDTMIKDFGSAPDSLIAGIGPSLGPCCAEFINYKEELPDAFLPFKKGENHFDFWKISQSQLVAKGVDESRIRISGLCTRCNQDLFFSYRRDKITGRLANVISINV